MGRGGNFPVGVVPVDDRAHPVDKIQINVIQFQLAERFADGSLHVVVIRVPQLGDDVELGARDSSLDALGDGFSNLLFISINHGGVDVTVTVFKNGFLDHLLRIVRHEESSESENWDLSSVVQSESGASLRLDCADFDHLSAF